MKAANILQSNITPGNPTKAHGAAAKPDLGPESDQSAAPAPEPAAPKRTKLKFKAEVIALSALTLSSKIQARDRLDKEALSDYTDLAVAAKAKGAESPLPALKAVRRGEEILVFSGFTRFNALKKAGYEETKVEIADSKDITDAELFVLAIEANLEHGARLSGDDKLHNLNRILKFPEYADLSNNALAPIVGCSEGFIRKHRPVAKSGTVRKTKKGGTIQTKNIGRKGGKTDASKGATTGPEDKDETKKPAESGKKSSDADGAAERAISKICSVIDGHGGYTEAGIRKGIADETIKLSVADLELWKANSDARIKLIAPLVIGLGWSVKKALQHVDAEVNSKTKLDHVINLAIATQDVLRRSPNLPPGEVIADNQDWSVIVWNTKKYSVTVTEK